MVVQDRLRRKVCFLPSHYGRLAYPKAGPSPGGRPGWDSGHLASPYTASPQSAYPQMPPSAGGYRGPNAPISAYQQPTAYGHGYPGYQP
jgi:hypothetical protein